LPIIPLFSFAISLLKQKTATMFSTTAAARLLSTAGRRVVVHGNTTLSTSSTSLGGSLRKTNGCRQFFHQSLKSSSSSSSSGSTLLLLPHQKSVIGGGRRLFSEQAKKESNSGSSSSSSGWWSSPQFWGAAGAIAGWGMSGAAIYDAAQQGPEVISLTMTPVLIVYSTLFARWAWVVQPRNLLLMWCHITNVAAQSNQLRRALEYKMQNGHEADVKEFAEKTAMFAGGAGAAILTGPYIRKALTSSNLGIISTVAAAPAGPFTVHFWYVGFLAG
jgi:mitochondrial pyruvate carrier 1